MTHSTIARAHPPKEPTPRPFVRTSTLVLSAIVALLTVVLLALSQVLQLAHQDWSIQYFASDAAVYFEQYHQVWTGRSVWENPLLLLNRSPIVLMMLLDGKLLLILAINLALMVVSLKVGMNCCDSFGSRIAFLVGALIFPYFLFGFLSLNKEVYAMCSAIFFSSYWLRGRTTHLLVALLLAFAARYYMLVAIAFLAAVFPRDRQPRYWLALIALFGVSLLAPIAKSRIPGYSSTAVLDATSFTSVFFAGIVDSYGYALIYPVKYLTLVPTRLYSVAIGLGRPADPMEAVVSLETVVLLAMSFFLVSCHRSTTVRPTRLVMMAVLAPIPIMWTEIGHWRYFSYVYFLLLFAVILHFSERNRMKRIVSSSR